MEQKKPSFWVMNIIATMLLGLMIFRLHTFYNAGGVNPLEDIVIVSGVVQWLVTAMFLFAGLCRHHGEPGSVLFTLSHIFFILPLAFQITLPSSIYIQLQEHTEMLLRQETTTDYVVSCLTALFVVILWLQVSYEMFRHFMLPAIKRGFKRVSSN